MAWKYVQYQNGKKRTTSEGGSGGGGHDYSTTEQEIGTWIDGSTLYEKVVNLGSLPSSTSKNVDHNISNIDKIIYVGGWAQNSSGVMFPLPNVSTSTNYSVQITASSTQITVQTGVDRTAFSGYAIIQYTKSSS